jgi:hypothetical protein
MVPGCGSHAPAGSPDLAECLPVEGTLPPGARGDELAGDFHLTLVATSGTHAAGATTGTLRLRPNASPAGQPDVRYPLYGGADVELADVGAIAPGATEAMDPAAPGVRVIVWRNPDSPPDQYEIVLRLGAEGNRDDRLRFDGATMALFVESIGDGGFAGRWRSGLEERQAEGYFCAERAVGLGASRGLQVRRPGHT